MRRGRAALPLLVWLAVLAGTAGAAPAPAPLHLAPGGSDSGRCARSAPCKTFARAYEVARPGQHVLVAAGSYPGQQEIEKEAGKTSTRDVVFRPAPGAAGKVLLESLDVYGAHVEFRGLRIERDFYLKCGADDVTFRSSKASDFYIRSANNIRLIGSEFGPSDSSSQMGHTEDCQRAPKNILMDRVYMHDFTHDDPDVHMECMTVSAADNLVIRRSRFFHCEDFGILFKHRAPVLTTTNTLIENNWFDMPWPDGSSAIQFSLPAGGGTFVNLVIRNNSFVGKLTMKPQARYPNLRIVGNAGHRYGGMCGNGVASHNVWRDGACRGTDLQADPKFRDVSRFDLHLAAGSPAINRGHPSNFPRVDIDGQRRPSGRRADAGADEFRRR
jgi:Right handed beta helix region